jgi:WD40 repeat protein/serine/threonine protein kinase/Flp pilus assembly protein TadD
MTGWLAANSRQADCFSRKWRPGWRIWSTNGALRDERFAVDYPMNATTPDAKEIFFSALDKESPEDQSNYLDEACGGNAELRQRVEQLLRAHDQAGKFLGGPTATEATIDQPSSERAGTQIGPYKLLQQIGEGGFGVVYMAEQLEPVRRKVALKVIKPGMDTRQVIARFEAERQALAVMDHPHIAKVLDAGSTASGRPYFVMELVRGIPITQYCDESQLPVRERLALFATVCQAIQHAHTKGLIHRDIKPTNVLVTRQDGNPIVKVIDFGVAKAMGQQLTDKTLFTEFAQMIGTPLYMSPEQAELSSVDIDTRSDIYSLGVLLYELLTGTTPVSKEQLKQAAFDEIRRIIREDEPPKPSTRISTGEAAPSIAAQRHTEPAKLARLVRGELDWIVMKALEKDRSRRYETASGLAADIERYLHDEPVLACPPSSWYRFAKFARRNKRALAAAILIMLTMLGSVAVLAVSNYRIREETQAKEDALGKAKDSARRAAEQTKIAKANEKTAKANEELAHRRYYAAQMNLAMQAWEAGQRARALELLESQRPRLDQQDLRSFEWYYLWQLCNQGCRSTLRWSRGVTYSPDGQLSASKNLDCSISLVHVSTGRELAVLRGHKHPLWSLAFSPDGKTLASGDQQQGLKLWDVASGKERKTLPLGTADTPVKSLAFTADGKTLAVASLDITLWDVATGELRATLPGGTSRQDAFSSVAISPDAKTIAGGGTQGFVRLWILDGDNWREGTTLPGHHWGPRLAISPDGQTLATGAHRNLKLWDLATGKERTEFLGHKDIILSVAFSPDGRTLATGSTDRTVKLWDVATGQELAEYPHLAAVYSVAFLPDGKSITAADGYNTVKTWDVDPPKSEVSLPHMSPVTGLAFTPDSKTLLSGGSSPTQLWDVATGRGLPFEGYKGPIGAEGFAISSDRKTIASLGPEKTVKIWDLATGQDRSAFVGEMDLPALAMSPDCKTLAMWRPWRGGVNVKLWDIATGQPMRTLTGDGLSVLSGAFSPDGKTFAAGIQFFSVHVWDVATGRLKFNFDQDPGKAEVSVLTVQFSADGELLAAGNNYGMARVWDVETGQFRASFRGHTNALRALAFSPDGKTLASGSDDATVKLWDVATGQERITLRGHKAALGAVAFSPDGNTLATGSADGTIRLWRAATDPDARSRKIGEDRDDPGDPLTLSRAADRLRTNGREQEAAEMLGQVLAIYTTALERDAQEASLWNYRGNTYASLEHWKEASADFAKAMELQKDDPLPYYRQALLRLQLGDIPGYRRVCADMLGQFGLEGNAESARWTVWTCVLAADVVANWKLPLQLAEQAAADNPTSYQALNYHAAVLFRAGQYEEALQRLSEAEAFWQPEDEKLYAREYNWLLLAMVHHRLGHPKDAREWLAKAAQSIDGEMQQVPKKLAAATAWPWNRRLTLQFFRREAEELLATQDAH